ncbi:MAG: hypothetical protein ABII90_03515 [Bacteroidota bacterium]
MSKKITATIIILFIFSNIYGQDTFSGSKIWNSLYFSKDINKKYSVRLFSLFGFDNAPMSFSFNQNNLSLAYKISKKHSVSAGYTQYFYRWSPYYDKYNRNINSLGTISFNRVFAGYTYKIKILPVLRVKQSLDAQFFFQQLDKYQTRFLYGGKIYLYKKDWILKFSPFFQYVIYYYLNGVPAIYYDNSGNVSTYRSPNGFHRYRFKIGFSCKPMKKFKNLGLVFYYAVQNEFNLSGFGNDLNVIRPGSIKDIVYPYTPSLSGVENPFNHLKIIGFQLNFVFH